MSKIKFLQGKPKKKNVIFGKKQEKEVESDSLLAKNCSFMVSKIKTDKSQGFNALKCERIFLISIIFKRGNMRNSKGKAKKFKIEEQMSLCIKGTKVEDQIPEQISVESGDKNFLQMEMSEVKSDLDILMDPDYDVGRHVSRSGLIEIYDHLNDENSIEMDPEFGKILEKREEEEKNVLPLTSNQIRNDLTSSMSSTVLLQTNLLSQNLSTEEIINPESFKDFSPFVFTQDRIKIKKNNNIIKKICADTLMSLPKYKEILDEFATPQVRREINRFIKMNKMQKNKNKNSNLKAMKKLFGLNAASADPRNWSSTMRRILSHLISEEFINSILFASNIGQHKKSYLMTLKVMKSRTRSEKLIDRIQFK